MFEYFWIKLARNEQYIILPRRRLTYRYRLPWMNFRKHNCHVPQYLHSQSYWPYCTTNCPLSACARDLPIPHQPSGCADSDRGDSPVSDHLQIGNKRVSWGWEWSWAVRGKGIGVRRRSIGGWGMILNHILRLIDGILWLQIHIVLLEWTVWGRLN